MIPSGNGSAVLENDCGDVLMMMYRRELAYRRFRRDSPTPTHAAKVHTTREESICIIETTYRSILCISTTISLEKRNHQLRSRI